MSILGGKVPRGVWDLLCWALPGQYIRLLSVCAMELTGAFVLFGKEWESHAWGDGYFEGVARCESGSG